MEGAKVWQNNYSSVQSTTAASAHHLHTPEMVCSFQDYSNFESGLRCTYMHSSGGLGRMGGRLVGPFIPLHPAFNW